MRRQDVNPAITPILIILVVLIVVLITADSFAVQLVAFLALIGFARVAAGLDVPRGEQ